MDVLVATIHVLVDVTPAKGHVSIVAKMTARGHAKVAARNLVAVPASIHVAILAMEAASIAADKPKGGIFVMPPPKKERLWEQKNWKAEELSSRMPQRKYCHYWDSFLCLILLHSHSIVFSHVIALITVEVIVKTHAKEDVNMSVHMDVLKVAKVIVVEAVMALAKRPVKMPAMNRVKAI